MFFILLQILLVAIPAYRWLVATTPKEQITHLCSFAIAIVIVIFNIIIECIQERKKKKQAKKAKKKVRKGLKIASHVLTLAFLIVQFFFTETPHPAISFSLIIAAIIVIGDIIYLLISFAKKALADGIKEDAERLTSTVKAKGKSAIQWVGARLPGKKKKQEEPEAIPGPKQVQPTPVKKKTFPLHHEAPVTEAPEPIIQQTERSPKKRFSFPPFFKKKPEVVAEEMAEEVCEALPAPEVEEVEAPAPEKKKNPLLTLLSKKKANEDEPEAEATVAEEIAEALPAPEVEEAEAPAPEKKKNPLLALLPKKKASEGEPEAEATVAEEIAEALPAPEAEEVEEAEAPAPAKKKNPLLAFLPKKKGKVPEEVHTEEGVSEETLIK
ncbi:MAG: hypothetical protein IKC72_04915 [Clostridia bacterium]|nr:hypothetical protein [Clostridia bacterium]